MLLQYTLIVHFGPNCIVKYEPSVVRVRIINVWLQIDHQLVAHNLLAVALKQADAYQH